MFRVSYGSFKSVAMNMTVRAVVITVNGESFVSFFSLRFPVLYIYTR